MKLLQTSEQTNPMKGRVAYLLALVVIVQTIYPITTDGSAASNLFYNFLGLSVVISGILVARERPRDVQILVGLAVVWGVTLVVYAFNQNNIVVLLLGYLTYGAFYIMVIKVLMQFIFSTRTVSLDVLYAAVAVYLLLGAIFTPIYGTIETISYAQTGQHAFSDPLVGDDDIFPWQNLIYYSYATLTTLGYGDVLPVTPWSRSVASMQAVIGVLYVTIIMARLVSLYVSNEVEEDTTDAKPEQAYVPEHSPEATHAGD